MDDVRGVADECNVRRDVQHTAPRVGSAEGRKRLFLSARLLSRDGFGMGGGGVLGAPGEFVLVGCGIGRGGLHAHYVDEVCHFETEEGVDGARVLAFSASWGVKYLRVNPAWYALVRTVRKKHTKETTYVPRRCISPMAPILQAPRFSMALVCVKGGTYSN